MTWIELTAAVLSGVPKLPGALCRGHAELFDARTDEAASLAVGLCGLCPSREPCAAWAAKLPHNGAHGVLAGERREWVSHPSQLKTSRKEIHNA